METNFWHIDLGNIILMAGLLVSYAAYRVDRRGHDEEQIKMHQDNKNKLDQLLRFQSDQTEINSNIAKQVHELSTQTATITEMAAGLNRRLIMMEDRGN